MFSCELWISCGARSAVSPGKPQLASPAGYCAPVVPHTIKSLRPGCDVLQKREYLNRIRRLGEV